MKILFSLFLLPFTSSAAIICVGASSSGSGNGSDWNNQAQWSSVTLTRGNTYYLADGSYAGRTLSTAASGTSLITIKKALTNDSAVTSITGWVDSLGNGQATFSSQINITTSYWLIDGGRAVRYSKTLTDYGFAFGTVSYPFHVGSGTISITDITVTKVGAIGPTTDTERYFLYSGDSTRHIANLTVSYCFGQNYANFIKGTGGNGHGQRGRTNWLAEYNMAYRTYSSGDVHGEAFNNGYGYMWNWTIRYNIVESEYNQGPTGMIVVLNDDSGPYLIYGNVFLNYQWSELGIGGIHHPMSGVIYNNTFINCRSDYAFNQWIGAGFPNGTQTAAVRNNLVVNMEGDHASSSGGFSYTTYANCTEVPSESNRQIMLSSPLVNVVDDFHLVTDTDAGVTLGAPYDVDPDGITRGQNGNWSRGAYQFYEEPPPGATNSIVRGNLNVGGNLIIGN